MSDTVQTTTPLLASAKTAAQLCGVSVASWWAWHSSARVPMPIHLGRRTLWKIEGPDGLKAWVTAGCPARERWETMRGTRT